MLKNRKTVKSIRNWTPPDSIGQVSKGCLFLTKRNQEVHLSFSYRSTLSRTHRIIQCIGSLIVCGQYSDQRLNIHDILHPAREVSSGLLPDSMTVFAPSKDDL